MALDVTTEIEIARDCDHVAVYAFNPANDPVWIGGIVEAEQLTPGPIGKETQVRRQARFLGRRIDYVLAVSEFVAGRRMVMESVEGPFPMRVTYEFEPAGSEQTRARIRVQGTASKFYGITDWLMAPMVRRNISKDLKQLKGLLEREAQR